MGLFRSVVLELPCARCGSAHPTEVQFKTGRDWCESYAVGDEIDDLAVSEEWEGIADRFCPPCQKNRQAERERAMATVVAAKVRAGKLALKVANSEARMTPDEILARGEEKAETASRSPTLYGLTLVLSDLFFLNHDGTWLPTTQLHEASWSSLRQALQEEMRRLGWPHGDELFREDLSVYLDDDRRVQVRLV